MEQGVAESNRNSISEKQHKVFYEIANYLKTDSGGVKRIEFCRRLEISKELAESMILEIERRNSIKPSDSEAVYLSKTFMGYLRKGQYENPTGFAQGVKKTLMKYPKNIAEEAIENVSENEDFVTRSKLKKELDRLLAKRSTAISILKTCIDIQDPDHVLNSPAFL